MVARMDLRVLRPAVQAGRERLAALGVGFGRSRVCLAVSRGRSAAPAFLQRENAVSDHLPESSVQGAAIGLVAERTAEVVAVEHFRDVRERRFDFVVELPGGSPGRLRRRGRSRSGGRRSLRTGGRLRRQMWKRHGLFSGRHPHQIQGPNLLPMGGFEQLDAGAELLVEPTFAGLVFFACHRLVQIASQSRVQRKRGSSAAVPRPVLILGAPASSPALGFGKRPAGMPALPGEGFEISPAL